MKALVLILRGLPAGAIGPYGNRWVETPTLNALAVRGVVYDWHFSVHPSDRAARLVWGSGRYAFPSAPPPGPTLVEAIAASGARTWLITDEGHRPPGEAVGGWQEVTREGDSPAALAGAREALDELAGEDRWLLWVELSALLPPWTVADEVLEAYFAPPAADEEDDEEEEPAEAYLDEEGEIEPLLEPETGPVDPGDDVLYRRIQTSFAAAVTQLDLMLDDLLAAVGEDVLVVVTSDRGQALGEHGIVLAPSPWVDEHRLHEELVHVPLLLAGPGCPPGRRVEALTVSVDLAPTLAAHFGVTLEGGAHGHDIRPSAVGEGPGPREYVCLGAESRVDPGEVLSMPAAALDELRAGYEPSEEWAIRTPDWYLRLPVQGGADAARRLYVKPDDRCEVNDVSQAHFHQADALEQALRQFVEAARAPGPLHAPPLALEGPAPAE